MNFASKYTFHDSDDEGETVEEDRLHMALTERDHGGGDRTHAIDNTSTLNPSVTAPTHWGTETNLNDFRSANRGGGTSVVNSKVLEGTGASGPLNGATLPPPPARDLPAFPKPSVNQPLNPPDYCGLHPGRVAGYEAENAAALERERVAFLMGIQRPPGPPPYPQPPLASTTQNVDERPFVGWYKGTQQKNVPPNPQPYSRLSLDKSSAPVPKNHGQKVVAHNMGMQRPQAPPPMGAYWLPRPSPAHDISATVTGVDASRQYRAGGVPTSYMLDPRGVAHPKFQRSQHNAMPTASQGLQMAPSPSPYVPPSSGRSTHFVDPQGVTRHFAAPQGVAGQLQPPRPLRHTMPGVAQGLHSAVSPSPYMPSPSGRSYRRKVDTNILNVDMASLGNAAAVATGDPCFCTNCHACLSSVSILIPSSGKTVPAAKSNLTASEVNEGNAGAKEEDQAHSWAEGGEGTYSWVCEFCRTVNALHLDEMEKPDPTQSSVDYILEGPTVIDHNVGGREGTKGVVKDESTVLFALDISGSMCVTTEVEGRLNLRGDRTQDLGKLRKAGDARNQRIPGQRSGVTYVSRLQSMQAAIDAQLKMMSEDNPDRRVGLVTFNGEVTLVGDASQDPRSIAGDRLSNPDALRDVGKTYPLSQTISSASDRLRDRLFGLEETGPTALGPAALAGLSMLKERGGRGSRLVICTDGLANIGLGSLDELKNEEDRDAAGAFYTGLGREAVNHGIIIDVISLDSDKCDLENLGSMADLSNGSVTRVQPAELAANVAGILASPVLATQVSVRVMLHKGLKFRNVGIQQGSEDAASLLASNTLERDVGNVTAETELSFEYQVRPRAERQSLGLGKDLSLSGTPGSTSNSSGQKGPPSGEGGFLPFQVQITYTRLDGSKCVRVITRTQEITKSRRVSEGSMEMSVVAGHASQQAGMLARRGAYHNSKVSMRAYSQLMGRNATTPVLQNQVDAYSTYLQDLDQAVSMAQMQEQSPQVNSNMGGPPPPGAPLGPVPTQGAMVGSPLFLPGGVTGGTGADIWGSSGINTSGPGGGTWGPHVQSTAGEEEAGSEDDEEGRGKLTLLKVMGEVQGGGGGGGNSVLPSLLLKIFGIACDGNAGTLFGVWGRCCHCWAEDSPLLTLFVSRGLLIVNSGCVIFCV